MRNFTKTVFSVVTLFVMVSCAKGQAPSISYPSGAKVYTVGNAINPLTPTNLGGAVAAPGSLALVTTLAGSGSYGYVDGIGTAASFRYPNHVAVDVSGNVYVADYYNHRIRKVSPLGIVTTFAGSGNAGYADGNSTSASFSSPAGITVDVVGNLYVSDFGNNRIRKITPTGVVTTLAGSGVAGYIDDIGTAAAFRSPNGIAVDRSGNIYVADQSNNRIRKVNSTGIVTTLAGSGNYDYADGIGTMASFRNPAGVAVDGNGNVFVADFWNNRIRKISPVGMVTTLAGSGNSIYADGNGIAASFNNPLGIAVDSSGNVYVADLNNNRIRKVSIAGAVITLAGSSNAAYADGVGTAAFFNKPLGLAVDGNGNLYVGDQNNNRIRKIYHGGYSISPILPTGLSLDAITGIISGSPLVASASADYLITAVNTFGISTYTISIAVNSALPLNLLTFTAQQQNNTINLAWQTTNEVNTSHFTVQRSIDGTNFSDIGKVAAKGDGGYSYIDNQLPSASVVYYRLQMVDKDGSFTYSKVISCKLTDASKTLAVYPNPVWDNLFVQITSTKAEKITLQVTDLQGRILQQEDTQVSIGNVSLSINTSALAKGSYVLLVKGSSGVQQKQFVKE